MSDGLSVLDLDGNLLHDGGAIEAVAGLLPLLALELVESDRGTGDGKFRLGFVFPGALQRGETLEDTFQGALGGSFVAVEKSEFVKGFGRPESGIGLRRVERGFHGIESALPAPEKPAAEGGVFDQVARVRGFGGILVQEVVEQRVEIFLALAGNNQLSEVPPCTVALRLDISLPAAVTGPVCGWSLAIRARVWCIGGVCEPDLGL